MRTKTTLNVANVRHRGSTRPRLSASIRGVRQIQSYLIKSLAISRKVGSQWLRLLRPVIVQWGWWRRSKVLSTKLKLLFALLVGAFIYTNAAHAQPPATDYRKIAYGIETGRDNGDTDEDITERCIPSGDSLKDFE